MGEREVRSFTPAQARRIKPLLRVMSRANVWVYRLSGGKIGGRFLRGAPVALLTTLGRRSGKPRTVPLLYLEEGESVVLVASQGGMDQHPLWYRNLEANPEVELQIGRELRSMTARRASDDEKRQLWPRLTAMYRDFDDYQARTRRDIPVLILSPR